VTNPMEATVRSGREVLLEVLATEGVRFVFGNPGTTELPFMDALAETPQIEYVLVLHEATAIGMADGYAQATGRPAFVNLHTAAGLGNAMGVLANAHMTGTPMVITAGQQHRGHLLSEPFLSGDLVEMARALTRWAYEVHSVADLGSALRRAFHQAAHPPSGPVFVSIPMDVLEEEGDLVVPPPSEIDRRSVPTDLARAAEMILGTPPDRFAIVAGDEVARSDAIAALVMLAETLGAKVFGTPLHSNTVFPTAHPLWAGALPTDARRSREILSGLDLLLLIGARGFMTFMYEPTLPVPSGTALIHLSPSAADLGRTYPATFGMLGDPRSTLEALEPMVGPADTVKVAELMEAARADQALRWRAEHERANAPSSANPMDPATAVRELIRSLPAETIIVDEAPTADPFVRMFHRVNTSGRFYYSRGGGLGWGMGAAIGVSLGSPGEPILCVVGDGSALYSPQALWTAARRGLPVIFAVMNNRHYLILKQFLGQMQGASAKTGTFVGVEIDEPEVDFVSLAASFGVDGRQVDRVADIGDAVRSALGKGGPFLLELTLAAPTIGHA
jgi:benzoylformate decarboxylase